MIYLLSQIKTVTAIKLRSIPLAFPTPFLPHLMGQAAPSTPQRPAQAPAATGAQLARDFLPLQVQLQFQHELQVIAWWSGRGAPGKTTLGFNSLALGGAVEPTVLVELDTMAASLECPPLVRNEP